MQEPYELRSIAPDDLFRLKFLQDASLSPDGRTIAYAVSHVDVGADEERVTIWLHSLETGTSWQLTNGLACDTSPQWSPDGRLIAFISTRSGKPQVYVIPIDGGEARQLTSLQQGVDGPPQWSPDGRMIAFTAGPEGTLDLSKPYRLTRHIYRFDRLGYLDGTAHDIYVISVIGAELSQLTNDTNHNTTPRWSPDGQELLFKTMLQPDAHRSYEPVLRVVNLAGGVRDLFGAWGSGVAAAWTPDSQRIVFIGRPSGRPNGSKYDLWVIDRQGGEPQCRTADLSLGTGGSLQHDMATTMLNFPRVLVSKDGQTTYVQVQDGGTIPIYRISLDGLPAWTAVVQGERSCLPLDLNERHLLFGVSTLNDPLDLFIANIDGSDECRLTQLNADLAATLNQPTIERLWFSGSDGVPVEGWIMCPPGRTRPYPTILYIHGGPHAGFGHIFSCDFQMLAGAGYAVLFINQRGSTGYGDAFATQIIGDWGNLDYGDLMAGVDDAIARGISDSQRLGCCGLSGGGNLTCWIVGQTDRFKAAVPENPLTNWISFYGVSDIGPWFAVQELGGHPHEIPEVYRRCSPVTYAHRCRTPTLLVQGEADYRCPAEQSEQFYTTLKASGCVVEMLRLPASPHVGSIQGTPAVRRAQNTALLDWMNRYVLRIDPV